MAQGNTSMQTDSKSCDGKHAVNVITSQRLKYDLLELGQFCG